MCENMKSFKLRANQRAAYSPVKQAHCNSVTGAVHYVDLHSRHSGHFIHVAAGGPDLMEFYPQYAIRCNAVGMRITTQ